MKHGKYETPKLRKRRSIRTSVLLLCAVLVLALSAGGTLAYILADSHSVTNAFVPGQVNCEVVTSGNTISVKNTGNVSAYLRAAYTVNWMDSDGNVSGTIPSEKPSVSDGWNEKGNIYYYNAAVASGGSVVFLTDVPSGTNEEYTLTVEVVAEAIQADGVTDSENIPAYQDAWGISSNSGN